MMKNMGYGQERLKDIVENEAEEEQEEEKGIDLTPHEHERALRRTYRSFVTTYACTHQDTNRKS